MGELTFLSLFLNLITAVAITSLLPAQPTFWGISDPLVIIFLSTGYSLLKVCPFVCPDIMYNMLHKYQLIYEQVNFDDNQNKFYNKESLTT